MSEIDLGLGVLDHQLLDCEGRRCGNVDDLELELEHEDGPRVVAILSGPGAWRGRGRPARLVAALTEGELVRIPWEEVRSVESGIRLARRAEDYGLGRWDDVLRPLVARLPGGER